MVFVLIRSSCCPICLNLQKAGVESGSFLIIVDGNLVILNFPPFTGSKELNDAFILKDGLPVQSEYFINSVLPKTSGVAGKHGLLLRIGQVQGADTCSGIFYVLCGQTLVFVENCLVLS